jgi:hypothetical protein
VSAFVFAGREMKVDSGLCYSVSTIPLTAPVPFYA